MNKNSVPFPTLKDLPNLLFLMAGQDMASNRAAKQKRLTNSGMKGMITNKMYKEL